MTKTNSTFNRRSFLKSGTAVGAAALATPALVSKALASSGEMTLMDWSDYWPEEMLAQFTSETGIKVNYIGIGSNEELINKMKASNGAGADLIGPTNNRSLQWGPLDLVQPFDMSRINIDAANPAMAKIGPDAWDFGGKGNTWIPHIWGTEGMAWRVDKWAPADASGVPSYGEIWDDANAGKTMIRAHSGMLCAGLFMEASGQMDPGSVWAAYESEENMRKTWAKITDWCIARKGNLKLIWNDADSQKNGLLNDGVVVGQTWDGPPLALKTAGEPVTYQAPAEGAMAWVDGLAMPKGAKNIDQVYELIKFAYNPENAGKAIDKHGYNSPILGADKFASANYAKNFSEAYPGDALANLNAWPAEAPWYANIRTEFVNKFQSS
ncbi:substrate-binding domain-containing protein [Profundibacter sp.]|uniref:substrate-binding domain-containing protein n=1 Tax=Profundibacter sp. TaxID=3101071 RepID=UPI003D1522C6